MQQIPPKKNSEIWNDIQTYSRTRLEFLRLKTVEKVAKLMADVLSSLLLLLVISIVFLAATITIAFYLSELWGSCTLGFGFASLLFLAASIAILLRKGRLEYHIGSISVKRYFDRHCFDEEDGAHPDIESRPCDQNDR